jgi:hypothetical protein
MKKILFLILISSNVIAESYLCIGEAAGGVIFNENTSEASGTSFKPTGKLLFRKEGNGWVVTHFGQQEPLSECENVKSYSDKNNVVALECNYPGGTVRFSFDNLRFINTYEAGWNGPEKYGDITFNDTPNIEVGRCSKI